MLVRLTSLAPLLLKVTAPVNTFARVKVMGLAPALKLDAPGTVITPICVIGPVAVTVKLRPTVEVCSIKPMVLLILTSLAPVLLTFTSPVNTLFCVKVIGFAPALKSEFPSTVNAPVCVIAPTAVTVKLLPTLEVPNTKALLLVRLTSLAPLLLKVTAPVNKLFCVNVIALAPTLKLDVPPTVNIPFWVKGPVAVTVKFLPTVEVAKTKAMLLLRLTSLAPLLFTDTAPVNALARFKVIGLAPALKVAVPGTVWIPTSVIGPFAVRERLPPLVKVAVCITIPALSNTTVTLRKLVKPIGKAGNTAATFIFLKLTSRILANVPPKVGMLIPKSFAKVKTTSEFGAVNDKVVVPPDAVIAPVCETVPPEDTLKFWPMVEVPITNARLSVIETSLAPLLLKLTAPVKTLFWVRVIGLAPALKLEVPGTVNTPV